MNEAGQKTMILADAGLINNPNICIKNYGSTVACVCEKCNEEFSKVIDEFFDSL